MTRRLRIFYACLVLLGLSPLTFAGAGAEPPGAVSKGAGVQEKVTDATGVTPGRGATALRILGTEIVGQLTGRDSPNDTASRWDVHGTDLGHMFRHDDALYMVFGDTYGPSGSFGVKNWRSSTMARIADPDPRNGLPIETMISGPDGTAKELVSSRKIDHDEMTVIPTYGISIGGRMHLHYMSVKEWGEPGHWTVGHSGIAYSDDDGQTWVKAKDAIQPPNSGFEQVAFVLDGDLLYTFGIPEGRYGGVKLRRAPASRILDPDASEYWDGSQWVDNPSAAATIAAAPVGELSVAWSGPHRQWLMMYLQPDQHAVVLRTAPQLTGPWSDAQVVVTAKEYPGLYSPYIVPGSEIGSHLYYTMSLWKPYNVFLMRTTLERDVSPADAVAERTAPTLASTATPRAKRN